jgi:hypothetical protein
MLYMMFCSEAKNAPICAKHCYICYRVEMTRVSRMPSASPDHARNTFHTPSKLATVIRTGSKVKYAWVCRGITWLKRNNQCEKLVYNGLAQCMCSAWSAAPVKSLPLSRTHTPPLQIPPVQYIHVPHNETKNNSAESVSHRGEQSCQIEELYFHIQGTLLCPPQNG